MSQVRTRSLIAVLAVSVLAVAGCSSSSKTASSSSSSSSSAGGGITAPPSPAGAAVNVTVSDTKGTDANMTLTAPATSAAGDVTFTVKNSGTIEHEVVVLKTDTAFDQLAVGASEADKVDESANVGETGEPHLAAGETRSFTITGLASGNYVLVCNIAKHYALGMRAAFKVS